MRRRSRQAAITIRSTRRISSSPMGCRCARSRFPSSTRVVSSSSGSRTSRDSSPCFMALSRDDRFARRRLRASAFLGIAAVRSQLFRRGHQHHSLSRGLWYRTILHCMLFCYLSYVAASVACSCSTDRTHRYASRSASAHVRPPSYSMIAAQKMSCAGPYLVPLIRQSPRRQPIPAHSTSNPSSRPSFLPSLVQLRYFRRPFTNTVDPWDSSARG